MQGGAYKERMIKIAAPTPQELTRILQKYKTGKRSLESRVVSAENWWKLRNRAEERRDGRADDPSQFQSVSGWLHNVIVSKHADAMDAFPEPVILPREPGDRLEAKMLSAVIPCILEQNRFEQVYDRCMWQKLKTGTAAYRVVWDGEKLGGLGDVSVERVDLLNLFWEPGVDDIQKSRYVFHTHLEDNEELEEKYPHLRGRLGTSPFMATRFVYDDGVSLEGKQTVIEAYYKRRGLLHYCKYVGDTVLYATEKGADEPAHASPVNPDPSPAKRVWAGEEEGRSGVQPVSSDLQRIPAQSPAKRVWAGEEEGRSGVQFSPQGGNGRLRVSSDDGSGMKPVSSDEGLYAHGQYPFVLDPLFPVEGSPCGYGFVDLGRNVQTAIDLMRTALVKNTMVGATPRYFQRVDGSVNEEEFSDLSRSLIHVSGNLGEDSLRQVYFSPMSGVYLQALESAIAELRETTGNTETATGNISAGVTAASAIAALQEASGKGSRDASRASYQAFARIVELIIELIRQFYTLPRRFRITGELGEEDYVSYSNLGLLPRTQGLLGGLDMGLRLPVFDVKVSAQKRNVYSRLSQNELAMQLYKLGLFEEGREDQAAACLDLMDFDGREALLQRLSRRQELRERLTELEGWKALALELPRRYQPERLPDLAGSPQTVAPADTP